MRPGALPDPNEGVVNLVRQSRCPPPTCGRVWFAWWATADSAFATGVFLEAAAFNLKPGARSAT